MVRGSGREDGVGACCERPAPEAYASRAAGAEVDGVVFRTRQTVGCLNRDDLELFLEAALPASLQQGLDAFFNTACGRLQQSVMDVDGPQLRATAPVKAAMISGGNASLKTACHWGSAIGSRAAVMRQGWMSSPNHPMRTRPSGDVTSS